jgi:hypothetical protein
MLRKIFILGIMLPYTISTCIKSEIMFRLKFHVNKFLMLS